MSPDLYPCLAFLIASLTVLTTTPIIKTLAIQWGHLDRPNHRKIHQSPTVRLGGISIFLGFTLALIALHFLGGFQTLPPLQANGTYAVALGALAYFTIGLLDDFLNLSPLLRLILQIAVAMYAWSTGVQISFLTIPGLGLTHLSDSFSLLVTVLWLVGITNAINWMDGLDGLAAGMSGIAATVMLFTCIYMHQPGAAILAAAVAGCSLGFLRYNFNPAQIFMGDGGSYFLGFTLAGISVIGLAKGVTTIAVLLPSVIVSLPYLILALPILDMSAVILDRLRCGKSPFTADKRHLHHRLMNAGISHRRTVLYIYTLTLWIGSLAFACLTFARTGALTGFLYLIPATGLFLFSTVQIWQKTRRQNG
jgi:UDP-GlcNAc:undecaprenyl-phosphate/decaprenyl-phosphate GlcNAc-1-phosphate transferase